jgi:polar amino acid transport system permease protein
MTAAIVGLALNEAAYMAEIIRGGLLSVDRGQAETAEAFGMTRARALRRIIIPQAMRSIVPPTGNQLISMIKATSLVSVIAMADLLYSVQSIYNATFQVIPMLLVAVIWYLFITSMLNVGQGYIERYYGRGDRRSGDNAAVPPQTTYRPRSFLRRQAIECPGNCRTGNLDAAQCRAARSREKRP